MLKGGSGAAGGGHRISAGRGKRRSTKSLATQAQSRRPFVLMVGVAVGFPCGGLSGDEQQQDHRQLCLDLLSALRRNGAKR
jgi:hypothetical protein